MKKRVFVFVSVFLLISIIFSIIPVIAGTSNLIVAAAVPTPTVVPEKYRWNLEAIYPDNLSWENDFSKIKGTYIAKYKDFEGKLNDPEKLLELFKIDEEISRTMDKMLVYASMKKDEDNTSSLYTEMSARISSLYTDVSAASSYVRPELIGLPQATLESYMSDIKLLSYRHYFTDLLKMKDHTLNKDEEKILALAGDMAGGPETIAVKIREADIQFPKITDNKTGNSIQLSEDQYGLILSNPDRDLRKRAFIGMMSAYSNSKNSLAAALDSQVRKDIFFAKTRKYNTSLAASVESNNIPVDVFNNILSSTEKNLPSLQKYITLRKDILKIDKVHGYDLAVSLIGSSEKAITYDESRIILDLALAPLGTDYILNMNNGFDNRWIDVFPSEHKTSGAYAWGSFDTHPYILSNFTNTTDSVLTIAHEMGHAMNSYYTNKNQPYIYSTTPIFNAEIASTTNELLTLKYLLDNSKDDNEKLYYLDKMAENIRGTYFTQVMFAIFEKNIHDRVEAGDALSVDSLNIMWGDLIVKFYGPDYALDELSKGGWMRIPHFYYDFYVYQYATGLAASNQFFTNIISKQPGAVEKYIKFLSSGGSNFPVDLLKEGGVDITTSTPVDNLMRDFNNILDQMEVILIKQGKIKK